MITHALLYHHACGDTSIVLYTQDGQKIAFDEVACGTVESAILTALVESALRRESHGAVGALVTEAETLYFV
jgi:hypothetical protein